MVQDRAGGGDRIAAEEHRQAGQLCARDQAQADRFGAGDGAIKPRRAGHRIDMDLLERPRELGGFAIGMARIERSDIGIGDFGLGLELGLEPVVDRFARTVEHPQREAQRPHVLGPQRILVAQAVGLDRLDGLFADVEGEQVVFGEAVVLERIGLVMRLVEVALGERAGVGNHQPAGLQRRDIGLQRRRVHRHKHIGRITRSVDFAAAEIDLEGRDAEQRALRRADFGGEIGERGQVIAGQRGRQGELPTRQLHAIAGIAGEAHNDAFGGCGEAVLRGGGGCCHPDIPCLRHRLRRRFQWEAPPRARPILSQ